jgi:hypothetical protein
MQRLEQHALAAGLDGDEVFLAAQRQLPEPDLPGFPHGVAHDTEGVLGKVVCRGQEVRCVVVERRDLAFVDELDEIERLFGLELDRVELLVIEQDVFASSSSSSSRTYSPFSYW